MSRAARGSAVVALVLLLVVGALSGEDSRGRTATTFGDVPSGFKAVWSLLGELGLPVSRSFVPPDRLPTQATVWWLAAPSLCSPSRAASRTPSRAEGPGSSPRPAGPPSRLERLDALAPLDPRGWIEAGGTAVVFLPTAGQGCGAGDALAGVALPERIGAPDAKPVPPGSSSLRSTPVVAQRLTGEIAPRALRLRSSGLSTFASLPSAGAAAGSGPPWRVVARLDGRPFALARRLGRGRLVLVADAAFLSNRWLAEGDAGPLAVDLARAYGAPLFDELAHGLGPPRSGLAYLLHSAAFPFLLGVALLGATTAWRGAALPPRRVAEIDPSAPTLATFVDSLAALYARSGDHARVFERYRELIAGILRRHFGLPPESPKETLVARLERRRGIGSEGLRLLAEGAPVRSRVELERAVGALDRMVAEATR